jgi:hypothetical protein
LNIRQNREDAGEAVAGQIERLCRDSQGRASGPLGAALDVTMGIAAP